MKGSLKEQSRNNILSSKNSSNSPSRGKKSGRSSNRYENENKPSESFIKPKMSIRTKKRKEKSQEPARPLMNAFSLGGFGGELEPIKEHQDEVLKSHQKLSFGKVFPEGSSSRVGSGRSSRRGERGHSNIPPSLIQLSKEFQEDQKYQSLEAGGSRPSVQPSDAPKTKQKGYLERLNKKIADNKSKSNQRDIAVIGSDDFVNEKAKG